MSASRVPSASDRVPGRTARPRPASPPLRGDADAQAENPPLAGGCVPVAVAALAAVQRCADCLSEAELREALPRVYRLTVLHDPGCPWLAARERRAR